MLRFVRVTRDQFGELILNIPAKNRWCIEGLPVMHLWLPASDVVIVRNDEVEFYNFPSDEPLTMAASIHCAFDNS